jgi:hypothetical protein
VPTTYTIGITGATISPSLVVTISGGLNITSSSINQYSLPLPYVLGGAYRDLRNPTDIYTPAGGIHLLLGNTAPYPSHYFAMGRDI